MQDKESINFFWFAYHYVRRSLKYVLHELSSQTYSKIKKTEVSQAHLLNEAENDHLCFQEIKDNNIVI